MGGLRRDFYLGSPFFRDVVDGGTEKARARTQRRHRHAKQQGESKGQRPQANGGRDDDPALRTNPQRKGVFPFPPPIPRAWRERAVIPLAATEVSKLTRASTLSSSPLSSATAAQDFLRRQQAHLVVLRGFFENALIMRTTKVNTARGKGGVCGFGRQSVLRQHARTQGSSRLPRPTKAAVGESVFGTVEQAPPDPILGVTQAFRADEDPSKLNLGVGAYRNDDLQPVVLNVVRKAEQRVVEQKNNKEYLPIDGFAPFNKVSAELMFGETSDLLASGKIVTLQSLSGTGSLRVGAAFINRFFPGKAVYIPNPSWGNHKNIFADAGVKVEQYKYFDKDTIGLDFAGMIADLKAAPSGKAGVPPRPATTTPSVTFCRLADSPPLSFLRLCYYSPRLRSQPNRH